MPDAPDRDLYRLAAELMRSSQGELSRVVNPDPVEYAVGRVDNFWLIDIISLEVYSSPFELRLVTPHAYWYFEEGQSVDQEDIERSAALFEKEVYPLVTSAFGREWTPGVDNDPHLNILNAALRGVGGYFSSSDEYPVGVNQYSNQREIIYINSGVIKAGTTSYLEVLAHELQHAVHWNADLSEDTWVNEGLSELATTIAGFDQSSIFRFLRSKPTSLVNWPLSPFGSGPNYGSSSLFMHYLSAHYGDRNDLRGLLTEPKDGVAGITAYLESLGHDARFEDVFRDWAVANLLDEEQGPYSYPTLEVRMRVTEFIDEYSEVESQIPQYAVEYLELVAFDGPLRLRFQGSEENRLLPVDVGPEGCWWGNAGDVIDATLTRGLDLTSLDLTSRGQATLRYQVWFNLEEDWDYGYVEVSVDGGQTWEILAAPGTTSKNPIGNSFGTGYTGDSGGWLDESVDLSGYSGQSVLLRFQHVTDDAVNGSGICFRGISIPEAGLINLVDGWQSQGFVLTDNRVKQDYIVQVIEIGAVANRVRLMALDETNSGEIVVAAPQNLERLVVAVGALAPKTREEASYTLVVEPAD
ncbi:MAG: immune inhibitor A [Chloroflexi bacterium]|nr:immune inhibitor A [Chloroflexota bacterium]